MHSSIVDWELIMKHVSIADFNFVSYEHMRCLMKCLKGMNAFS